MLQSKITTLILLVSLTNATLVTFLPDNSFNLPFNFDSKELPCSKQTVIFPSTYDYAVNISSVVNTEELILPISGEIELNGDTSIILGTDDKDDSCMKKTVHYIESETSWAEAGVWSSPKFNKATPDGERLPCFDDDVIFPERSQFSIKMPESKQYIRSVNVNFDSNNLNKGYQEFIYNDHESYGHEVINAICPSRAGCPCQTNQLEIDCSSKYCKKPTCENPIKPKGNCCKICGGYIYFNIDNSFDYEEFQNLVEETIKSYGPDKVEYHIGRIGEVGSSTAGVHLIIVDKGDYDGTSSIIANVVEKSLQSHWVQGYKSSEFSGSPLSKSNEGVLIAVSVFFIVILVFGGIYLYFYKLQDYDFNVTRRDLRDVSRRFNKRTDSVVTLTRRDSIASDQDISAEATTFRNPMYDSCRGRTQSISSDKVFD